jgi:hypothetical protein
MALPVVAITNVSTCLTDRQVEAAIPALQRQVTLDFKAYWDRLTEGWWQISVTDNPDQAGALGYHELTSRGTPLGKVFAALDIQSGGSWTVTLSHELLEMLADPWINWCAQGSDGKIYALEVCDAVEADNLGYKIGEVLVSDFISPRGSNPRGRIGWTSSGEFRNHSSLPREVTFPSWMWVANGCRWRSRARAQFRFHRGAEDNGGLCRKENGGRA